MEWSFEGPGGAVTVRQEGEKAVCQAIRSADERGLYKAWLQGSGGKLLLGTLIPEGGALRLRRVMETSALEAQGVWPPTGGEIAMAYPFAQESAPPPDWLWTDCPQRLMGDPILVQCLRGVKRALLKRELDGFLLALPWSCHSPFPIPPLFCLSSVERLGQNRYAVFHFSRQGRPELLHNFSDPGENRSEP